MIIFYDYGVFYVIIYNGIIMVFVCGGGYVNDMLIFDWFLSSFVFWDNVGVDVVWVRYYLECFLFVRKCVLFFKICFLFFFSWNVVFFFLDVVVVKVFYWFVIIW